MGVFYFKIFIFTGLMRYSFPSSGNLVHTYFLLDDTISNRLPDVVPLFAGNSPLFVCLMRCLSISPCLSVFQSTTGLCRGYQYSHFLNATVVLLPSDGETYFHKVHDCSTPNYTWNSEYRMCFHYHSEMSNVQMSKALCKAEDPWSHLLLVDSDKALAFLEHIIAKCYKKCHKSFAKVGYCCSDIYQPTALYLQGEREDEISPFVDDFGREMTYFVWADGEPDPNPESRYLRTVKTSLTPHTLMEVSGGYLKREVLCVIM